MPIASSTHCSSISFTAIQQSAFAPLSSQRFASSVLQLRKFQARLSETRNMTTSHLDYTFATHSKKVEPTDELPSDTVTIDIFCNRDVDLQPFSGIADLKDFNINRDGDDPNIIVFEGIYPDNKFNKYSILRAVQRYDRNARFANRNARIA